MLGTYLALLPLECQAGVVGSTQLAPLLCLPNPGALLCEQLRVALLQATTRTSMALSAARGGGMRWTWAGLWAPCAVSLCSRCAAEAVGKQQ